MRTERGLDRFVTFLDAVVAIAITLLVLPLVDVLGGGASRPGSGQRVFRRGRQVCHVLPELRPYSAALARPSPHRRGRRRLRRRVPTGQPGLEPDDRAGSVRHPGGRQLPAGAAGGPGLHGAGAPRRGLPVGDRTAGLAPAGAAPGRRRAAGPAPVVAGDQRGVGRGPAAGDAVPGGELLGAAAARSDDADRVVATSQRALHVEGPQRLRSWPVPQLVGRPCLGGKPSGGRLHGSCRSAVTAPVRALSCQTPVTPSMRSRMRSAWPAWRAYSAIMWL